MSVRSGLAAGRYADGNGLYLVVDPSGAKRWMLRTVVLHRRRDIGLGSTSLVSLAEVRDLAIDLRRKARAGGDPVTDRRKLRLGVPNFEEASRQTHEEHKGAWRNAKHVEQWINTLRDYAWPVIGKHRVDQIETPDILRVLAPIWLTKSETARRVRQRIGSVLDWASASGYRSGENPVRGVVKGLPRQPDRKTHFSAMDYVAIPAFVSDLQSDPLNGTTGLAMEFLILTACRTNEVIGATWDEFNLEKMLWTIPAKRMKAKTEHRVPLTPRVMEIIGIIKSKSLSGAYVFAGTHYGKPLSNMALLMLMRRSGIKATVHGFRSSFRDWASERTSFPAEVCEMALAHTIKNKAEAAYRRGDLFGKRRALMEAWAAYVKARSATVIRLRS
jgi:integrase